MLILQRRDSTSVRWDLIHQACKGVDRRGKASGVICANVLSGTTGQNCVLRGIAVQVQNAVDFGGRARTRVPLCLCLSVPLSLPLRIIIVFVTVR